MSAMDQLGKYQPYPEYKDSGVEWLGIVPNHWDVCSLKRYIVRNDGGVWGNDPLGVDDTIVLRSTEQTVDGQWIIEQPALRQLSQNEKASSLLVENDLVVTKSSGSTIHIGKTTLVTSEIAELQCCYSNFMQRIRLHCSFLPKLAWYIMNNLIAREQFNVASNSTIGLANLNSAMIGQLLVVVPTEPEQRTIAAFLDYETARIDQLIAKQQQLIELLKEKRQAVISHAVTKGLNPNVPMKDSGVEWLGQVPEHWVVSRIKNYAKIESGHTPSRQVEAYWENCTIPWVSLNDSKTLKEVDYISDTYYQISELGMANSSAHLLPEKAVVFTRDASIGLSAITTKPMAVSQHLIAWICKEEKVIPEYLLLVFYAMEKEFERYTFGATIKTIGMDDVRSLTAAFPDIDEQKKLISWAFTKLEKLKSALQKAESTIALLQERRTALISAAVTGKIDLRGWQPPKREVAA